MFSLGIFLLLSSIYALIEPRLIEEKHFKIKSREIPPELSGKKIVFLSDTHCGLFFSQERLNDLVARVSALQPDIVFLGGDYADGGSRYSKQAAAALGKIKGVLTQTVGVLGNHDYQAKNGNVTAFFEEEGIKILNNENLILGEDNWGRRLIVAGIEDLKLGWPNLDQALASTSAEDYVILLSHNPDVSEEKNVQNADLILSGHTHGGQITFFGLWAPITMSDYGQKYVSGLTETSFGQTITSNGIGTVALPMRFFARPQIVVIELESAERKEISLGGKKIMAEVARTDAEREKGLMDRKTLCPECGMLFVFNKEEKYRFWMKNTLLPLDMIFIDKTKKVADIQAAEPCLKEPCRIYEPKAPCSYVLEVPAGTFTKDLIGQNAFFVQ